MASITLNDLQESLDLNSSALANVLGGCYRRPRWGCWPPRRNRCGRYYRHRCHPRYHHHRRHCRY